MIDEDDDEHPRLINWGSKSLRHGRGILCPYARGHRCGAGECADWRCHHARHLRWDQVYFRTATLHVRRAKSGKPAVHPIRGDELRMLRELQRNTTGAFVFETERGGPFTADAV